MPEADEDGQYLLTGCPWPLCQGWDSEGTPVPDPCQNCPAPPDLQWLQLTRRDY